MIMGSLGSFRPRLGVPIGVMNPQALPGHKSLPRFAIRGKGRNTLSQFVAQIPIEFRKKP
jgi:hypothetical protein